jgi:NifU-like protein involved in Fe-S cluster formation
LIAELPNRGDLPGCTHSAFVENPVCGDITQLFFKVEGISVADCRFKASGCPAAIASAVAVTLICPTKTVQDCLALTLKDLIDYLGGLPAHKAHGAELALQALHNALNEPI